MRLDLFLKASRLCSRRTIAQKICEAGRVFVNGSSAKSSHAVKAGDEILLRRHDKLITVRVLSVPTARQTSRKDAGMLYEVVGEELVNDEEL
ncbi:MAG TPA: RNA-binding S4 domain-containing protein [Pyrinomonadaceae bacterium]|nr:RNA-binding S4 domain-containing protein [Pyrinomonadaceae bacterium]